MILESEKRRKSYKEQEKEANQEKIINLKHIKADKRSRLTPQTSQKTMQTSRLRLSKQFINGKPGINGVEGSPNSCIRK